MPETIGEKIRTVRKSAGLTQAQLANKLGVTPQTVSQYECGDKTPKLQTLRRIARAMNVPLDIFIEVEEGHNSPMWVSVKDRLPEVDDDEPFARCIVNVIRWSEGWTGLWNQPEPSLNEEEFTAAATYNSEQKIFTVYDGYGGSMIINALLSPDDCGDESGCRVTHWMEHPAPVGFLKREV